MAATSPRTPARTARQTRARRSICSTWSGLPAGSRATRGPGRCSSASPVVPPDLGSEDDVDADAIRAYLARGLREAASSIPTPISPASWRSTRAARETFLPARRRRHGGLGRHAARPCHRGRPQPGALCLGTTSASTRRDRGAQRGHHRGLLPLQPGARFVDLRAAGLHTHPAREHERDIMGEWGVRQTISAGIETFRLASPHCAVPRESHGRRRREVFLVPAAAQPASVYSPSWGASCAARPRCATGWRPTRPTLRAATRRARRSSRRICHAFVAVTLETPSHHTCLLSGDVSREQLRELDLSGGLRRRRGLLAPGRSLPPPSTAGSRAPSGLRARLRALLPRGRYESVDLSSRVLPSFEARLLGVDHVSEMSINESARRELMAQRVDPRSWVAPPSARCAASCASPRTTPTPRWSRRAKGARATSSRARSRPQTSSPSSRTSSRETSCRVAVTARPTCCSRARPARPSRCSVTFSPPSTRSTPTATGAAGPGASS